MQKSALLQSQVVPGFTESQNLQSSIMRALDFTIDVEENELYPPEDLRASAPYGLNQKIRQTLQKQKSALDEVRMSNPSSIYGDQQKKFLMLQNQSGRNVLRQSNEMSGSKG